jgi:hypothetical protein
MYPDWKRPWLAKASPVPKIVNSRPFGPNGDFLINTVIIIASEQNLAGE